MTSRMKRKVLRQSLATFLFMAFFLVLASSTNSKKSKKEESEAELEHNARVWIDALLDRMDDKHTQQTKKDFQKNLNQGREILIE